jgi:16S rRNA A1518/A1519 N6-dimethyltransferase RsmA/KsgA/DIM1 with predicted DNA glycosylase/AP lyase activity
LPDLEQHWLLDIESLQNILNTMHISERDIVEIGVGTGNITYEILQRGPAKVIGLEIDATVVPTDLYDKIKLHLVDVKKVDLKQIVVGCTDPILISAPPYDCLSAISTALAEGLFSEALLMIPESRAEEYLEWQHLARLDGDAFSPASRGSHIWVHWIKTQAEVKVA